MTFDLLTNLRDAADAADELDGHLNRYTDPAKLASHLRSAIHGWTVHAHEEDDLFILRAAHTVAHQADLQSARARVAAAEDMLADAQEAAEDKACRGEAGRVLNIQAADLLRSRKEAPDELRLLRRDGRSRSRRRR